MMKTVIQVDPSTPTHDTPLSDVVVIDDVFTADECDALVSRAMNEVGFVPSKHKGKEDDGFRRSGRAPFTDAALARRIFERVEHRLPCTIRPDSMAITRISAAHLGMEPRWGPPRGLWEELRVLAYEKDDFFKPHWDNRCTVGQSSEFSDAASFLTLLLYLNDRPSGGGGQTRISCPPLDASASELFGQYEGGTPTMGQVRNSTIAEVKPVTGRVLIFPHRLVHEGARVEGSSTKFVLRGDILYAPPTGTGDKDEESEDAEDDPDCRRRRRR